MEHHKTSAELGLFDNIPKCKLISASASVYSFEQFEQEMITVPDGNMSILGSSKLNQKNALILESLDDAQSSFNLFVYCASFCKMVWFIQTIPPDLISECCINFDSMVLNCFELLSG